MANEKALPVIPSVPLIDSNGQLSRVWHVWFRQAFTRMGGADASTNKELEELNADLAAMIAAQAVLISSLQTQINAVSGLGVGPVL